MTDMPVDMYKGYPIAFVWDRKKMSNEVYVAVSKTAKTRCLLIITCNKNFPDVYEFDGEWASEHYSVFNNYGMMCYKVPCGDLKVFERGIPECYQQKVAQERARYEEWRKKSAMANGR